MSTAHPLRPRSTHHGDSPRSDTENALDVLLVGRIRCGDERALVSLYDRWVHAVYSVASHLLRDSRDAEEIVEQVFARIWREAERYDPERGSIGAWIVVIARSQSLSRLRDNTRRARNDELRIDHLVNDPSASTPSPLLEAETNERQEIVRRAVSRLPAEQQHVVRLTFFDGLSQTEIASALGLPLGTVKTRVRLAFLKLRGSLAGLRERAR